MKNVIIKCSGFPKKGGQKYVAFDILRQALKIASGQNINLL